LLEKAAAFDGSMVGLLQGRRSGIAKAAGLPRARTPWQHFFNALIIPLLIPVALKGVRYRPIGADALLRRNLLVWGLGGVIAPFIGIKLIDMFMVALNLVA
jgi:hypothetical protein